MAIIINKDHEKTETIKDLIKWIRSQKTSSKKEKISTKVDEIVYGIGRPKLE